MQRARLPGILLVVVSAIGYGSGPLFAKAIYPTGTSTSFNAQNASHQIAGTWGSLRLRSWIDGGGVTNYVVGCKTCHNPHNSKKRKLLLKDQIAWVERQLDPDIPA